MQTIIFFGIYLLCFQCFFLLSIHVEMLNRYFRGKIKYCTLKITQNLVLSLHPLSCDYNCATAHQAADHKFYLISQAKYFFSTNAKLKFVKPCSRTKKDQLEMISLGLLRILKKLISKGPYLHYTDFTIPGKQGFWGFSRQINDKLTYPLSIQDVLCTENETKIQG